MRKLGRNEKPLSIIKLISAGLITFTVPENSRFVVGEDDEYGDDRLTGFVNSNKQLTGWGFKVISYGDKILSTTETMWDRGSYV